MRSRPMQHEGAIQMKAFGVFESLSPDSDGCFREVELEVPSPGPHDLLVRVRGVSVNPVDAKQRQSVRGLLAAPRILGWDACGEVVAAGDLVENFKIGDRVMYAGDLNRQGSYAEFQVVDERIAGAKPTSLTEEEAAALPLTSLAAWEALFERLEIDKEPGNGAALLVIGGAGGLGSMAIQLARRLSNCTVIATASRPESREWCTKLGAHYIIDHSADIPGQLSALGHGTVPYILNCSNNMPYWEVMSQVIAPEGSVCLVASTKAKLDLDIFMAKSARISWELMFTKTLFQTKSLDRQGAILNKVRELIDTGQIIHTKTASLGAMSPAALATAHRLIEEGKMIGKVTLSGVQ